MSRADSREGHRVDRVDARDDSGVGRGRDESRMRKDARDESRARRVVDDGRDARMGDGFQIGGPTEGEMRMFRMMIMAREYDGW